MSKLLKRTKGCNMYVILKLLFIKNLLFGSHRKNSKSFWSNVRLIWLTRHFGGSNSSKGSQKCHINVYGNNYLRKQWPTIHSFKKYMENTIIIPRSWYESWRSMVIIPWSSHESWQPCQETWPPCRHHGMILIMFRHDQGIIMARSWHGSHIFPTRVHCKFHIKKQAELLL